MTAISRPLTLIHDFFSMKKAQVQFSSFQFSRSVVSNSLQPHESQHARPPCSSPSPGVHSDSCPSSQWCHPAISSSVIPFFPCPQSLPASVFSNESTLRMRWPKYWSFSFSIIPSKGKHKRTRNLREEKMQGEPARNTHGFVSRWSYILSMGNENWNWEYELSHCSCHPRNLSHISLGENKGSEIAMECRKTEKRERERMRMRECQQKETREVKK